MTSDICVTMCAVKKFLFEFCEIPCFSFVSMLKKYIYIKKTRP